MTANLRPSYCRLRTADIVQGKGKGFEMPLAKLTKFRIPEGVKDEEAGPIMCGGVTAYTACKRSAVRPGQ
jgi:D-arabinose 1-dehydrogenase-like Zn-dependent alcohol dehydrogenase